jgi:hypothetical protein
MKLPKLVRTFFATDFGKYVITGAKISAGFLFVILGVMMVLQLSLISGILGIISGFVVGTGIFAMVLYAMDKCGA